MKHIIYFKVVSIDEQLPIELSLKQHKSCPNRSLQMESYKETMVSAVFDLVSPLDFEKMIKLIKWNIKRTHKKVLSIEQFEMQRPIEK